MPNFVEGRHITVSVLTHSFLIGSSSSPLNTQQWGVPYLQNLSSHIAGWSANWVIVPDWMSLTHLNEMEIIRQTPDVAFYEIWSVLIFLLLSQAQIWINIWTHFLFLQLSASGTGFNSWGMIFDSQIIFNYMIAALQTSNACFVPSSIFAISVIAPS